MRLLLCLAIGVVSIAPLPAAAASAADAPRQNHDGRVPGRTRRFRRPGYAERPDYPGSQFLFRHHAQFVAFRAGVLWQLWSHLGDELDHDFRSRGAAAAQLIGKTAEGVITRQTSDCASDPDRAGWPYASVHIVLVVIRYCARHAVTPIIEEGRFNGEDPT